MGAINAWMARRSGVELFLIYGVYFGVAFGAFTQVGGQSFNLVVIAIGGAVFGLLMAAATLWGRRKAGGQGRIVEINTAIDSGELPGVIDPSAWLGLLDLRLVNLRRTRVTTPIVFGIIVASELLVALTGTRINYSLLVLTVLVALAAVGSIVGNRRRIPKIEALEQKIRDAYNLQGAPGIPSAS
jgi:hypothetical protein